ncbi:siderophore-interacting protein [Xanthomonas vasicola]|uniref:siderophore-interacting protein n=1 Tax=Xanthomonas vasicola TaxID=56459 RepID=UPI000531CF2B|nr:siderophore-interacting protein [Xanthomonas vasicola]AZR33574.1 siderophore-interacting protein [Xanthomonas vasicola]KGR49848.1 iron utilization protein [Xanthomonas vasicola]KGR52859.1 iron utilization protein [Xanthomonas vasicola]KGT85876.1 iron utilization protein [Xanthomonas vasicola]
MAAHTNTQVRHDTRLRSVQVVRCEAITPQMRRIVFGGSELAGFESTAPDDHVKLFFPNADGAFVLPTMTPEGPRHEEGSLPSPARDYTPRLFDPQNGELRIDFVLHGDGVASSWAAQAQPGDPLNIGGPRGSFLVADDYDHYVLIGDETALPAIGRWLEAMPADMHAEVFIEIADAAERQELLSAAEVRVNWLERNGFDAASSTLLEDSLRDYEPEDGDTFYWIGAESMRARAMRKFLEEHLGVDKAWVRAKGYWKARTEHGEA